MKKSDELKVELLQARARLVAVRRMIADAQREVAKLEQEKTELAGGTWHDVGGKISRLETEITSALRLEADAHATPVVWAKRRFAAASMVVAKVTNKRIYVREPGASRCEQFLLDGESPTRWKGDAIDIRATFGIDADEVPPNWTKELSPCP